MAYQTFVVVGVPEEEDGEAKSAHLMAAKYFEELLNERAELGQRLHSFQVTADLPRGSAPYFVTEIVFIHAVFEY